MTEPSANVGATIASWSPPRHSQAVCGFARAVVAAVSPKSPERARALLFAAGKLAEFASSVGLELEATLVLHPSVIERFCSSPRAGSPATRRTLRSNLRHLARAAVPHSPPEPVPMPRDKAKPPYSPAEISSYLALSDTQPTALRRARSNALICLGAGAGLVGTELRQVRGSEVVSRSGGVLVEVGGRRPRSVPVLAAYHERLCAAAAFFGSRYLVSGTNPNSHNVTNPLITALSGGLDLERLDTGRLRSTYLAESARQIGLAAFMEAAGISCSQRLGDLLSHLESPSEEEAVARLGARRAR
jgi:integrase